MKRNRRSDKGIKKRFFILLLCMVTAAAMLFSGCTIVEEDTAWEEQDESYYDGDSVYYDPDEGTWSGLDDEDDEDVSSEVIQDNPLEADESNESSGQSGNAGSGQAAGGNSSGSNAQNGQSGNGGNVQNAGGNGGKIIGKTALYKKTKRKLAKLAWKGYPYKVVNKNRPFFTKKMLRKARKSYKKFGSLDKRWRCTWARASLHRSMQPGQNEERGDISMIHPSGWRSGQSWERMHLIGWALSGENANARNLVTGTHYCNVSGMLPFEIRVGDYIRATRNHVLYRVTPIFRGKELVPRGVQMEARSIEDKGKGICFNIYCFNVRDDGSKINYRTGFIKEKTTEGDNTQSGASRKYVLNTSSMKFHYPSCMGAKSTADHNKRVVKATRKELMKQGYEPCGLCEP